MRFSVGRVAAAVLMAAPWAVAQTPVGPELQVNVTATGDQQFPRVARDGRGQYIVVWRSGVPSKVYFRRYSADGMEIGSEERVDVATADGSDFFPDVAADAHGNFTVVWSRTPNPDSSGYDVMGRRFSPSGVPQGPAFRVNSDTTGNQYRSAIAMADDGQFVVAWNSTAGEPGPAVRARAYLASGAANGVEFQVSMGTATQQRPSVAWLPVTPLPNRLVFTWHDVEDIHARVFLNDSGHTPLCDEFPVGSATHAQERYPAAASDAAGNFVIAWEAANDRILARLYPGTCNPIDEDELLLYHVTTHRPEKVRAAMAPQGEFVVTWSDYIGTVPEILGGRFDAAGSPVGPAFRVNTWTTGAQSNSAIAMAGTRDFFISWTSDGQDQSGLGVYAQRFFDGLLPAAFVIDPPPGNGVWEKGEGVVEVKPSWKNLTGTTILNVTTTDAELTVPGDTGTLNDGYADYGDVAGQQTKSCVDCYEFSNNVTFGPSHVDATFVETLSTTDQKTWTVHLGPSFTDVAVSDPFYTAAETLQHLGVVGPPLPGLATNLGPNRVVTRAHMAPLLLRSKEGGTYLPSACIDPPFSDVPISNQFCRWINELKARGVVGACDGSSYCPSTWVPRREMAKFLLTTEDPGLITDPPASCEGGTPPYPDVPVSDPFCPWIRKLQESGYAQECEGGNFCPTDPARMKDMAGFLTKTFKLTLYGPN